MKTKTKKHAGGRPSGIGKIKPTQLQMLFAKGFNDVEVAKFYGIDRVTLHRWRKQNPKIRNAVKAGRKIADEKVEVSLYEAACGYSHPEDKIFNDNGRPLVVPTIKHYAPDTVACMFWLCNRQKDRWQHIQKIEHSGPDGGPLVVEQVRYA